MLKDFRSWCANNKVISTNLVIVICVTLLISVGLIILASASQSFNNQNSNLFNKQLISLVVAMIAGTIFALVDLEKIKRYAYWLAAGTIILLILVLIPGIGKTVNGAQRWLAIGPMRFQPSDAAKIALVLVMARYLSDNQRRLQHLIHGYITPCAIIGFCSGIILLEPDFGTAFLCGCVGFGMLFLAGARLLYILPTILGGVMLFAVAVMLDPIRLKRITAFLDVEGNKSDGAYQLWQGILAFGSGGLHGVGLGKGRQQMAFLPEAHNDFIFPVIGEELGFYFTAGIALLYLTLFVVGYMSLKKAPTLYQFLLVAGALFFVVFQSLINMGVVTGLLPTKGMSLPFISYGGSNLLVMCALIGIILNTVRGWGKLSIPSMREL